MRYFKAALLAATLMPAAAAPAVAQTSPAPADGPPSTAQPSGARLSVFDVITAPVRAVWDGVSGHFRDEELSFDVVAVTTRRPAISPVRLADPGSLELGASAPDWMARLPYPTTRVVAINQRSPNAIVMIDGGLLRASGGSRDDRFAHLAVQGAGGPVFLGADGYYERDRASGAVPGIFSADIRRRSYEFTATAGVRVGAFDRAFVAVGGGLSDALAAADELYAVPFAGVPPFQIYNHSYRGRTVTVQARLPLRWHEVVLEFAARDTHYTPPSDPALSGGAAPAPSGRFASLSLQIAPLARIPRLSFVVTGSADLGSANHLFLATDPPGLELSIRYVVKRGR